MTFEKLERIWGENDRGLMIKKTAIMILAGMILGVITPYDSSEMPYAFLRYAYWLGTVLIGFALAIPFGRLCFERMNGRAIGPLKAFLIFSAVISVPIFAVVVIADLVIYFSFLSAEPFTTASLYNFLTELVPIEFGSATLGYLVWYAKVFIIVALIYGAASFILERGLEPDAEDVPRYRAGQVFLNRLPSRLGTSLTHLSMEGHYVRAHTGKGDALIHMRLADALVELEGYAGMQVHRSHWVAFDAIERITKDGRRRFAALTTGASVPVSQTYYEQLKELGVC
ncbi:LytTR family DNA-binding domain-containing protein [Kordiimonas gwangyangensis]|uniref:LytTR family DNA-binding domain-containing protein n=1 Tax=Kordiimonas gwangyangensis TaxID=288022 RepID=UPI0004720799|nr:LytTR family DNA-binding domain-containing protein [Kordiimonas gwangyangensis]